MCGSIRILMHIMNVVIMELAVVSKTIGCLEVIVWCNKVEVGYGTIAWEVGT